MRVSGFRLCFFLKCVILRALRGAEYGIQPEDCEKIADNAIVTMGGLFRADPRALSREEIADIVRESI